MTGKGKVGARALLIGGRPSLAKLERKAGEQALQEPRVYQMTEVEFGGRNCKVLFYVAKGRLTVSSGYGTREAALNESSPEDLVPLLFNEIMDGRA